MAIHINKLHFKALLFLSKMRFLLTILGLCGLFCFAYSNLFSVCQNPDMPTILSTLSGKIKGECFDIPIHFSDKRPEVRQVHHFHVPYAEPPSGENRFKLAIPIKPWDGIKDGSKLPSVCMQIPFDAQDLQKKFNQSLQERKISEDCLYLNVYVPTVIYQKLVAEKNNHRTYHSSTPIYVFIHGGGFISGSGIEDIFEPSIFSAISNVIVITLNYRLGAFGFLHLSETNATGNQGLLDQALALKWIYNNAASFGGDQSKITLGGHGMKIYFYIKKQCLVVF